MRDDQMVRLQALSERLGEVVIQELDPHNWPGAEKVPAELTQQERGDRYWCKKNAAATMTLLLKTINIATTAGVSGAAATGAAGSPLRRASSSCAARASRSRG